MTNQKVIEELKATSKKNFDNAKFYRWKRDYPRAVELIKKGLQLEETLKKDNK